MPKIIPDRTWPGTEVFIIGGGKSLESFDWSLLRPELTIGCNDAFLLGEEVCKIAIFGDFKWYNKHKVGLSKFKNRVFTNTNQLQSTDLPWLYVMKRMQWGLSTTMLGWGSNTGISAVNLALILGAKTVYLLGFDMHLTDGENNWHINELDKPNPAVYKRFSTGFERVKVDLPKKFPGTEIINVSDNSSLGLFPQVSATEFWEKRK